jgi:hypothetical protein
VRLFDWGEAVTLSDIHGLPVRQLMKDVGMAGTPLFMAPEAMNYLTGRGPTGPDALRAGERAGGRAGAPWGAEAAV